MHRTQDEWEAEQQEWVEALVAVLQVRGHEDATTLLKRLHEELQNRGVHSREDALNTPYLNSISPAAQPQYPGDIAIEQKIENIIRWNAAAMVIQAYDSGTGVGGHIGTYLSAATLMEVGFNHFFRADHGDQVHIQAHASPGVYARAWLEGRLTTENLVNFRRELQPGGGLPSYPHPRRMPQFWQMPTASMGLSTPCAIHQARFLRYLEARGLCERSDAKVWLFVGDGEADEPEVLGTINLAGREQLDNLIFVVNCNLQRLDGPVRGNGKIIQELERMFHGAGWYVIKVIWGSDWDPLFARDHTRELRSRLEELVDGDFQRYSASQGDTTREHLVGDDKKLEKLFSSLTDVELTSLKRGGHDHHKIYAAYQQAMSVQGKPCVILAKTVKGDGLGLASQGRNTIHQKKQLSAMERTEFASSLGIPLDDDEKSQAAFYRPSEDSVEMQYLKQRREQLGGYLPRRTVDCIPLEPPELEFFKDMLQGSRGRELSTTMALIRMLQRLLREKTIAPYLVPIIPDEARTFGMDGLIAQVGIYSPDGQRYTPVDAGTIAPYREASDGQILQEGICEVSAMAAFLAAGTAYATYGIPMIPIYLFYSIFGFQRVGDLVWAGGDMMCKGFLIGATSGRTTLNGEGVQHQDGHSHVVAATIPNLVSYDPAFAYELAVIFQNGVRRMYVDQEEVFYYLTVTNQNYVMPPMPEGAEDGILRGLYAFEYEQDAEVNLFGSGAIMTEVLNAAKLLREFGKRVSVWSVTSYCQLHRQALKSERDELVQVGESRSVPYVQECLQAETGVFIATTDYQRALPLLIAPWIPGKYVVLGTDGFGLSESREDLRDYFEVSADWIVFAALSALAQTQSEPSATAKKFAKKAKLDLTKAPTI